LRQFRIRGRLGAAIELSLDAVAHNLQKLFSVLQKLSEPKLKRSLRNAAMAGASKKLARRVSREEERASPVPGLKGFLVIGSRSQGFPKNHIRAIFNARNIIAMIRKNGNITKGRVI
jgi:fatty acid/phospholipid biosynthesis enzyme